MSCPGWARGPGDLPFLHIDNEVCRARLTRYGGQVLEWTPAGQRASALFLSPRATFAPGKAIRGGVPVCFPWFANHPTDPSKPQHGFARTRLWQLASAPEDVDGTRVALRLPSDDETRALWPADFVASLAITMGRALAITLEVENTGAADLTYESALHTYFAIGDIGRVRVHGLERTQFIDKVDDFSVKRAGAEPLVVNGEIDRVYVDTRATCTIEDPVLQRTIRVAKAHSDVSVVWNPGPEKGPALPDIGEDAWRRFICVETANCGAHAVRLAPRARHAMTVRITVD